MRRQAPWSRRTTEFKADGVGETTESFHGTAQQPRERTSSLCPVPQLQLLAVEECNGLLIEKAAKGGLCCEHPAQAIAVIAALERSEVEKIGI